MTLFVLAAATVAVAWRSEAATPAVPVAATLARSDGRALGDVGLFRDLAPPGGPLSGLPLVPKLEGLGSHLLSAPASPLLFGAAGYLAQGRVAQSAIRRSCGRRPAC